MTPDATPWLGAVLFGKLFMTPLKGAVTAGRKAATTGWGQQIGRLAADMNARFSRLIRIRDRADQGLGVGMERRRQHIVDIT